jgi:hypothetical protein
MQTIKARIAADHEAMRDVHATTVYGHDLTKDYAEIEVSDEVLAKFKGNPTIEVLVKGSPVPKAKESAEAPAA